MAKELNLNLPPYIDISEEGVQRVANLFIEESLRECDEELENMKNNVYRYMGIPAEFIKVEVKE